MLFLASVAGQIGSQTDPPYSASKAALINFAQCAAKDLAPYGVRVNALCPGMVETALNRSVWEAWDRQQPEAERQSYEEWAGEKVRRVVPLGRWQTPEDVAAMAVFLASAAGRQRDRTDGQRGRRICHALVGESPDRDGCAGCSGEIRRRRKYRPSFSLAAWAAYNDCR